jgi:hypothetical protein
VVLGRFRLICNINQKAEMIHRASRAAYASMAAGDGVGHTVASTSLTKLSQIAHFEREEGFRRLCMANSKIGQLLLRGSRSC